MWRPGAQTLTPTTGRVRGRWTCLSSPGEAIHDDNDDHLSSGPSVSENCSPNSTLVVLADRGRCSPVSCVRGAWPGWTPAEERAGLPSSV